MESDLTYAATLMLALSLTAILGGWKLALRLDGTRTPLFAMCVVGTTLYASACVGRMEYVSLFPPASAVLLSNLTPVFVCFLAGFAWGIPGGTLRRGSMLSVMVLLGAVFLFAPLLRPALMPVTLPGTDKWINGLCIQSDDATCGAAAAATLLRHHGIETTEQEMVDRCLTSRAGTEPLALFRGLLLRSSGYAVSPQLASSRPEDWGRLEQFPVLAMVTLAEYHYGVPNRARRLRQLLGKTSDGHAVVILGRTANGNYRVADPGSGFLTWDSAEMSRYFSGQAIYLQRSGNST